jgi:hypothetical protein
VTSRIYTRNIFVPDTTPQPGLLDAKTSRVSTRNNMGAMIPYSIHGTLESTYWESHREKLRPIDLAPSKAFLGSAIAPRQSSDIALLTARGN